MSKNKTKKVVFKPDVSVVIPVYGNLDVLEHTLTYLGKSIEGLNSEVILVDDKSPDFNQDIYIEYQKKFPFISHVKYRRENGGFPATCNDGAKLATSDYILFLSTDVYIHDAAVKILLEQLKNNPELGITFPKLLFFPNSNDPGRPAGKIQHAGIAFDFDQNPIHVFVGWEPDHPFANRVKDYNACTGGCFMIKRKLFYEIGGFDVGFGRGTSEDISLCMEVRMRKYNIRYLPQAMGYHYVAASAQRYNKPFAVRENIDRFKAKYKDVIPFDYWLYCGA